MSYHRSRRHPRHWPNADYRVTRIIWWSIVVLPLVAGWATAGDLSDFDSDMPEHRFEDLVIKPFFRETNPFLTPAAISVATANDLEAGQIQHIPDLALTTPGLAIGNNANTSVPHLYIRGVGTTNVTNGADLNIGVYLDDVYIDRGESFFFDLHDIERIEIMRGPQGTLYGRNTTGGAIRLFSRRPTPEFKAQHTLTLGSRNQLKTHGYVGGPLATDTILGHLSYAYHKRDGYTANRFTGSRLADTDYYLLKTSVLIAADEQTDIQLNLDYNHNDSAGLAYKPLVLGPILGGLIGDVTVADLEHVEPSDTFEVRHDTDSREERDVFGISGKVTHDWNDLTLESITAFRSLDFDELTDVDGTSLQLFNLAFELEQHQISQEFRLLNSDDRHVDWLIGAYIFAGASSSDARQSHTLGPGTFAGTNAADIETIAYAVFGEVDIELADRLSLTLGTRLTYEEKDFDFVRTSDDATGQIVTPGYERHDRENWSSITPRAILDYKWSQTTFMYVSVSRGFKSGAYNSFQQTSEAPVDQEHLTAYEGGFKSFWFDERLQLNIAAFFYDYTDLQVVSQEPTAGGGFQIATANAAKAEIWGIELDMTSTPLKSLTIAATAAFLSAEYTEFINSAAVDVSGNDLIRAPEWSAGLMAEYSVTCGDAGDLTIRGEYQYQGRIYFTETNESVLSQPGSYNVNARIAFETRNERTTFAVFGRNLTDEETVSVAFDFRPITGSILRSYNPPRTYGVEVSVRF